MRTRFSRFCRGRASRPGAGPATRPVLAQTGRIAMRTLQRLSGLTAACVPLLSASAQTFSIDGPSPTHIAFVAIVHYPDSLLMSNPTSMGEDVGGVGPVTNVSGLILPRHTAPATGYPVRDVDAISSNHGSIILPSPRAFRIILSIRRPDAADFGTCAETQIARNQEAGDLYISTDSFRPLPAAGRLYLPVAASNDCFRNQDQFDEVPSVGPVPVVPAGTPIDNLDGFDFQRFSTDSDLALERALYYSVSMETDPDFGAYIFYLPVGWTAAPVDPLDLGPVFARREQLGLTSGDDIDALVVFDADNSGTFTPGDAVLISLMRGSTSLNVGFPYHFAGDGNPSDVFMVFKTGAADGARAISQLAEHEELGFTPDIYADIDALEVVICTGDVDGDLDVDIADLTELLSNFGTIAGATLSDGDLDGDGDVDLNDLTNLLSAFGVPCI
jgi:hypothetical protein